MSRITPQQRSAWADHIQTQATSKLSQQAYCDRNQINLRQFGYWKRVFRRSAEVQSKHITQQSKFVPVQLARQISNQPLTISLPNGVSIAGIDDSNQHLVAALVGACQ